MYNVFVTRRFLIFTQPANMHSNPMCFLYMIMYIICSNDSSDRCQDDSIIYYVIYISATEDEKTAGDDLSMVSGRRQRFFFKYLLFLLYLRRREFYLHQISLHCNLYPTPSPDGDDT